MELIFIIIGIIAVAYGAVIWFYTGMTTFLWFWPLCGLVNFVMFGLVRRLRYRSRKKEDVALFPYVFAFTSYGIGVAVLGALLGVIFSMSQAKPIQGLDYVIVMGTELDHNRVSISLEKRLDETLAYHKTNPETIFVLSGGQGQYDESTEATVMYYYLVRAGVPARNLLLEFYSTTTREKIGYSNQMIQSDLAEKRAGMRHVFIVPGWDAISVEEKPASIGILTSDYNLYRAVHTARDLGMDFVHPISVKTDPLLAVHLWVSEAAAVFKDMLMGNL